MEKLLDITKANMANEQKPTTMKGPLMLPADCVQLWRKMETMAEELGVSYGFIYTAFGAADQYLGDKIKGKSHWKMWFLVEYCSEQAEKFSSTNLDKWFGEDGAEMAEKVQQPADLSGVSDHECQLLEIIAGSNTVLNCHKAALDAMVLEMQAFVNKTGKHPFDYVLEDMKDDIPVFCKMQLSFQLSEGTN